MVKRTTIELDEKLLAQAKEALAVRTNRETVEESLRRVVENSGIEVAERKQSQLAYLEMLPVSLDVDVLASGEMWR